MTWLSPVAPGGTALERVLGLVPGAAETLHDLYEELWAPAHVDPVLLELVRLRVAQLTGSGEELRVRHRPALAAGLGEDKVAALPAWPASPVFDDAERAVLAFTELYVIDPHAITDTDCATLLRHLTPAEAAALTTGLAVFDALARFRVALGVSVDGGAATVVDPVHEMA